MTLLTYLIDWARRLTPSFNLALPHVATYTRELPVSMARMYENAIDAEHLPWLHRSSFSHLEIMQQGSWGWRAKANLVPKSYFNAMELELCLDREKNRWITRTLSGLGKGTEIWTHAIPIDEHRIKVIVDFYIPKLPRFLHAIYRKQLLATYSQLYDEDVWMMATRQHQLNRRAEGKLEQPSESIKLGVVSDIEQLAPLNFDFNNHPYQLVKVAGEWVAYSRVCPHSLGPLDAPAIVNDGVSAIVECPWHGYQFDIMTRECISGAQCRLAPAPKIVHIKESNELWAEST